MTGTTVAEPVPALAPPPEPLTTLRHGEIEVLGRLPWSSNATLLARLTHRSGDALAVYKPATGERPLRDFPPGLHKREAAAWVLSDHLGWDLVPATVIRDGPHGEGSFQLFLPADHEQHYLTLRDHPDHGERLRALCAFDLVSNQTDRKSGHVLLADDGQVWAIDNGLSFHAEWKVRTVLWDYAGEPVPDGLVDDLRRLASDPLPPTLCDLLAGHEAEALVERAEELVDDPVFPAPPWDRYSYPWPLI